MSFNIQVNMLNFVGSFIMLNGAGMVAGKLLENNQYFWLFGWNLMSAILFGLILYIGGSFNGKQKKI